MARDDRPRTESADAARERERREQRSAQGLTDTLTSDEQKARHATRARRREALERARRLTRDEAAAQQSSAAPMISTAHPNPMPRPAHTSNSQMKLDPADLDPAHERDRGPKRYPVKVQATQMGYYDHTRRRAGDVFMLADEGDFSERWMIPVAEDTPIRTTTSNEALRQQHDATIASRVADRLNREQEATGNANVLGDE